jgi:hypothetical protein
MAKPVLSEVEGMAMPLDKAPSLRDESASRCTPAEKKCDLKKQSQFAVIQIGAKSYLKRGYDNNPAGEVEENKANRSQFHVAEPTGPAGKMEKPVAAAAGQPD